MYTHRFDLVQPLPKGTQQVHILKSLLATPFPKFKNYKRDF